jgi:hypothetical protein
MNFQWDHQRFLNSAGEMGSQIRLAWRCASSLRTLTPADVSH